MESAPQTIGANTRIWSEQIYIFSSKRPCVKRERTNHQNKQGLHRCCRVAVSNGHRCVWCGKLVWMNDTILGIPKDLQTHPKTSKRPCKNIQKNSPSKDPSFQAFEKPAHSLQPLPVYPAHPGLFHPTKKDKMKSKVQKVASQPTTVVAAKPQPTDPGSFANSFLAFQKHLRRS